MKESTLTARVGSQRHRSRDILDEIWEDSDHIFQSR